MPNIMICGFNKENGEALLYQIEIVMRNLKLSDDAVMSIVDMNVISCNGKRSPSPYIRICSTDRNEIKRIIGAFRNFKIKVDIEWLVLGGFVPANEMGRTTA